MVVTTADILDPYALVDESLEYSDILDSVVRLNPLVQRRPDYSHPVDWVAPARAVSDAENDALL